MSNALITAPMIGREASRLYYYLSHMKGNYPTFNVVLDENAEKLSIKILNKEKTCNIEASDLLMCLDDFSSRIIEPLVRSMLDWDRAFKMETWMNK